MAERFPIDVDLERLVRHGDFDFVKPGISKPEILAGHLQPDDWGTAADRDRAAIWRYGNFELHFERDRLAFLFHDHLDALDGGASIRLTSHWIFREGSTPTLLETLRALVRQDIGFSQARNGIDQRIVRVPASGVEMTFDAVGPGDGADLLDPEQFPMTALLRR